MSKQLIIFPFGGNAREALVSILAINKLTEEWRIIGFVDDDSTCWGKELYGIKVLGARELLREFPAAHIMAIPGNPRDYLQRKSIIDGLQIKEARFAQVIHPSVSLAPDVKIGYNAVLMPNIVVSCGVSIGNHCVILPNTTIAHDSIIGDYCCIGAQVTISGHVTIGSCCYIGSGTSIRDNIIIGEKSLVGLGSNVVGNVEKEIVVAGNPAKRIH